MGPMNAIQRGFCRLGVYNRWASLEMKNTLRRALLCIGAFAGWMFLSTLVLRHYGVFMFTSHRLIIVGFKYDQWSGFFHTCPAGTINVWRKLTYSAFVGAMPFVAWLILPHDPAKPLTRYLGGLILVLIGFLAGTGIRLFILRSWLIGYTQLNNKLYLGYIARDLQIEEWGIAGLILVVLISKSKKLLYKPIKQGYAT